MGVEKSRTVDFFQSKFGGQNDQKVTFIDAKIDFINAKIYKNGGYNFAKS
jgi:hypothetical protein